MPLWGAANNNCGRTSRSRLCLLEALAAVSLLKAVHPALALIAKVAGWKWGTNDINGG